MMKLLFTGASGFLGTNIIDLLRERFEVVPCGRGGDHGDRSRGRLRTPGPVPMVVPMVVLHAGAKVYGTNDEEQEFYEANYQGTINLCRELERTGLPRAFVFVSTVAVYGCDTGEMITEEHPLNGTSAYARSKIMAEEFLTGWCREHDVVLGIIRPSLFVGRNPKGNLGAMINGIKRGYYVNIAGGKALKSMVMAEDVVRILPALIEKGGTYNLTDTRPITYRQLSELIARQLGKRMPLNIPYWLARCIAKTGDCLGPKAPFNSQKLEKLTQNLTFSNEKARRELGWEPLDVLTNYR